MIFICGFMGSGKSTLLNRLKENSLNSSGLPCSPPYYFDLDDLIFSNQLKLNYKSLAEFIENEGIDEFRKLEFLEVKNLEREYLNDDVLVTLGGGTLDYVPTSKLIKSIGKNLWLNTSFEICFKRIKKDKLRPMASNNEKEMRELYNRRSILYKQADSSGDFFESKTEFTFNYFKNY